MKIRTLIFLTLFLSGKFFLSVLATQLTISIFKIQIFAARVQSEQLGDFLPSSQGSASNTATNLDESISEGASDLEDSAGDKISEVGESISEEISEVTESSGGVASILGIGDEPALGQLNATIAEGGVVLRPVIGKVTNHTDRILIEFAQSGEETVILNSI